MEGAFRKMCLCCLRGQTSWSVPVPECPDRLTGTKVGVLSLRIGNIWLAAAEPMESLPLSLLSCGLLWQTLAWGVVAMDTRPHRHTLWCWPVESHCCLGPLRHWHRLFRSPWSPFSWMYRVVFRSVNGGPYDPHVILNGWGPCTLFSLCFDLHFLSFSCSNTDRRMDWSVERLLALSGKPCLSCLFLVLLLIWQQPMGGVQCIGKVFRPLDVFHILLRLQPCSGIGEKNISFKQSMYNTP